MGAASAEMLAGSRPGSKGDILMQGVIPIQMMGIETWPDSVPVQFFATKDDPWVKEHEVEMVRQMIPTIEEHRYEGDQHLFADADFIDFLPEAAADMMAKVRAFIK